MSDVRIERLAELVSGYSLKVKKNDLVLIAGEVAAEPFIKEASRVAIMRGAHVMTRAVFPWQDEMFFSLAGDEQLKYVNPIQKFQVETVTKFLGISASTNPKRLSRISPEKMAAASQARRDINERFMERSEKGELSWCGCAYPACGEAQDAEMGIEAWEDFVFGACLCDKPNPVKAWKEVGKHHEQMIKVLEKAKIFRIEAPGTDLTLDCTGRKWINCAGENNMPDGEVFTAPAETFTSGKIKYNVPSVYGGREVHGVELTFKNGRVTRAKAEKSEDFLKAMLEQDAGAKVLGEFAIGTNFGITDYTKNILFDEKIGGSVHLALGRAYGESGGTNVSALHWDMILDLRKGGTLYADKKKIVVDGKITI